MATVLSSTSRPSLDPGSKRRGTAPCRHPKLTLNAIGRSFLRDVQPVANQREQMPIEPEKAMSMDSDHAERRKRPGFSLARALGGAAEWIVSSPIAQSADIQRWLIRHSMTKTKPLVAAMATSTSMAAVAVFMTAEPWAYAWLLAELLIAPVRLAIVTAFAKAEASGATGNPIPSVFAGIFTFLVTSAGCYQSVVSGAWELILTAGIAMAGLAGAVSSRNAGTPRLAFLVICILTVPFSLAALFSPIPHLFIVGIQLPIFACGFIFVMLDNYKLLLNLFHSEHESRRLAQHDMLTGLPNRALSLIQFDKLLAVPGAGPSNPSGDFTVFCLDLDGFKDVNDKFGHAAGDAVLVAVAGRLRDGVRQFDFISRIGGDEFVVLLPSISAAEAAMVAERIIASVAAPFDVGLQAPANIGISIGSARAPIDGETADELMRSADHALYQAKSGGKNLYVRLETPAAIGLVPAADEDARLAAEAKWSKKGGRFYRL